MIAILLACAAITSNAFVVSRSTPGYIPTKIAAKRSAPLKPDAEEDEASTRRSSMDPAKRAALDGVLNQIERNYGRGSVVRLGEADSMVVDCIGSGSLTLDAALGGGYPKGRVVEIYGPESSGKVSYCTIVVRASELHVLRYDVGIVFLLSWHVHLTCCC